jgi:hypothetical protein
MCERGRKLKRIVSSIIVVLLFLSFFAFAFSNQPAKASETAYTNDSDSRLHAVVNQHNQHNPNSSLSYDLQKIRSTSSTPPPTEWNKTYGGTDDDSAYSVVQTSDSGYALAGYTSSFGAGSLDAWLIKTDSLGNMLWDKTYGGTEQDECYSVVQTNDGGYALAGLTLSFGAGNGDAWLVKIDSSGNMLWYKTYGGTGQEWGLSVIQTSDSGYALAGSTTSFGAGGWDAYLVKTNVSSNIQWSKTYGGTGTEEANSVVQTSDGGYALAGSTTSFGAGSEDAWLVRTDAFGNVQWNTTYGGTSDDFAHSVVQTSDGGYALAGGTTSYGAGSYDSWLVKTDLNGNAQWDKTYGGTFGDAAFSVVQTSDGGYALAGSTTSFGAGMDDAWLIKIGSTSVPVIQISTPTFENHLRQKTLDEYLSDPSPSIVPQNDPWMDVTIDVNVSPSNLIKKVELKTSGTTPDTNKMDRLSDDTYDIRLQEFDPNELIELVSYFVGVKTAIGGGTIVTPPGLLWEAPRIKEISVTDVYGNVHTKDFDIVLPTLVDLPMGNSFGTMMNVMCPIDVLVTDSQNRSVGAIYHGGTFVQIVNEVPGSSYIRPSPEGWKLIYLPFSTEAYSVQAFGNSTGFFNITIVTVTAVDQNIAGHVASQSWQIQQGQTIKLLAAITSDGKISFIPEFPSFLVLPLFTMATLVATLVHKKKRDKKRLRGLFCNTH